MGIARTLLRGDTQGIAVSFGDQGAIFTNLNEAWQGVAKAPSVANTVGCGDAFLAGLLSAEADGLSPREQLHEALAVSAANAMTHGAGVIRLEDIESMRTRVTISEMW
jgi:fructose-1-phosphate kinase PfkB-like protein